MAKIAICLTILAIFIRYSAQVSESESPLEIETMNDTFKEIEDKYLLSNSTGFRVLELNSARGTSFKFRRNINPKNSYGFRFLGFIKGSSSRVSSCLVGRIVIGGFFSSKWKTRVMENKTSGFISKNELVSSDGRNRQNWPIRHTFNDITV